MNGFGAPMAYRGYGEAFAFSPQKIVTIGEMYSHAQPALYPTFGGYKTGEYTAVSALDRSFHGYKGGEYVYDENTVCWIANHDEVVDEPSLNELVDSLYSPPSSDD